MFRSSFKLESAGLARDSVQFKSARSSLHFATGINRRKVDFTFATYLFHLRLCAQVRNRLLHDLACTSWLSCAWRHRSRDLGRALVVDANDVEAEIGLHRRVGHRAFLERVTASAKGFYVALCRTQSRSPPRAFEPGVLGVLARELLEAAALPDLRMMPFASSCFSTRI